MLAEAGVVRQISEGDYDRQFAADELFDLIESFEARLSTASGDVVDELYGTLRMDESVDEFIEQIRGR